MSMTRAIAALMLFLQCAAAHALSYEVTRNFFDKPLVYSPESAIAAYEGDWDGRASTSLYRGEQMGILTLSQRYVRNSSGGLDCTMEVGAAGGASARNRFRIYTEGDFLVLAAEKSPGLYAPMYIGETKSGDVVWHTYYPFMLMDTQTDVFIGVGGFMRMESEGFKYAEVPQAHFRGLIHTRSFLSKKARAPMSAPSEPMPLRLDKNYFRN